MNPIFTFVSPLVWGTFRACINLTSTSAIPETPLSLGLSDPSTAEANRPLDIEHAKELAEYMKANLKIADAPNRLCITMSKKDIRHSLHATAVHLLYKGRVEKYNRDRENPETIKKIDEKMAEINAAIKSKKKKTSIKEYPWLKFATPNLMKPPILNRGQHRVASHRIAFPKAVEEPWTPENVMKAGWAADIVIEEKLTPDIIVNIRLNRADSYKAGSDGDAFLELVQVGIGPFPECRQVHDHFGGRCGNCVWDDGEEACSFLEVVLLDSDADGDEGGKREPGVKRNPGVRAQKTSRAIKGAGCWGDEG
ncbi:hypothetical protein GJ744_000372 [Endocarpon pusillum]|uniref:Uncharacterized protein n=1 Tax=Endocarpon pusillum TaxID=364733 RepID=A0A8H7AP22_9EURO|nr:hypothetical protein GJ744_000372 [Endocarpon pusillum]